MEILNRDRLHTFLAATRDDPVEIAALQGYQNDSRCVHPFTHLKS